MERIIKEDLHDGIWMIEVTIHNPRTREENGMEATTREENGIRQWNYSRDKQIIKQTKDWFWYAKDQLG